jgi:hypothetical protein
VYFNVLQFGKSSYRIQFSPENQWLFLNFKMFILHADATEQGTHWEKALASGASCMMFFNVVPRQNGICACIEEPIIIASCPGAGGSYGVAATVTRCPALCKIVTVHFSGSSVVP